MEFHTSELSTREAYKLLTGVIVPRPVAWITSLSPSGDVNLAPFSAFTLVSPQPPMVGITVGPKKDTALNVRARGEFVVNIADFSQLDTLHGTSGDYPPEISEVRELGIETIPSVAISTPRVARAPIQMECRLHTIHLHGDFGTNFVVGEIVVFHVADALVDNYRVNTAALDPICVLQGGNYARLGEMCNRTPIHGTRNPWGNAFSEDKF
jgi:flavin reductase (DIM6/NTAB) family NADH-FMN oxidoreductase RutF